jgi:hypothetical protein
VRLCTLCHRLEQVSSAIVHTVPYVGAGIQCDCAHCAVGWSRYPVRLCTLCHMLEQKLRGYEGRLSEVTTGDCRLSASVPLNFRPAHSWDVRRRRFAVCYRRFGIAGIGPVCTGQAV